MKNRRNYYRILHVQQDAPREVIRSSYRTIMQRMRMHPDLGGESGAAATINEAYATLTDDERRSAYDRSRKKEEWTRYRAKGAGKQLSLLSTGHLDCGFCGSFHEKDQKNVPPVFCVSCQSPLALTRQIESDGCDRRSIARVPHNHALIFCTHWPQHEPHSGRTQDVSLNGMKFRSETGLELDQIVKIDSQVLKAVARVTRCLRQRNGWVFGVQFLSAHFSHSKGSFIEARV